MEFAMNVKFDNTHPVWDILRLAVMMGGLTILLWLNSSNFDDTELRTIFEMVLVVGGFEAMKRGVVANGKKKSGS
jgi:hypothetical protein